MLLLLLLNREACISSREVSSCQPLLVRLAEAARSLKLCARSSLVHSRQKGSSQCWCET